MATEQTSLCSCEGGLPNYGTGDCPDDLGAPFILLISKREKENGTPNCIDFSVPLTAAIMNGLINNTSDDDRFIVIGGIKSYTPEQADPVTDEAANGDIDNVKDGVSSAEFEFRPHNIAVDARKWKSMSCLELQANFIDLNGNWLGQAGAGTTICGRNIEKNSFIITPKPKTFGESAKLIVKYNYTLSSGEETTEFLKPSDFVGFDLLKDVKPLRDVNIDITGITATTIDFKLTLDYGSIKDPKIDGVTGLTLSDLHLRNETDELDVVFATLVEPSTPDGTYSGTMASQDSLDVVHVEGIVSNVIVPLSLNRLLTESIAIP